MEHGGAKMFWIDRDAEREEAEALDRAKKRFGTTVFALIIISAIVGVVLIILYATGVIEERRISISRPPPCDPPQVQRVWFNGDEVTYDCAELPK